jgi:hypothetical protein
MGLEMAMVGKPVLLASRTWYEDASRILRVRSRESLPELLEKCLSASPDRDIQREAFRLAYCLVCTFEMEFPLITVLDIFDAKPSYSQKEDLAAGKDPSLDRICNYLIEGSPLFESPTTEDRSRSTAEEDAFFDQLDRTNADLAISHASSGANGELAAPNEVAKMSFRQFGRSLKKTVRQFRESTSPRNR